MFLYGSSFAFTIGESVKISIPSIEFGSLGVVASLDDIELLFTQDVIVSGDDSNIVEPFYKNNTTGQWYDRLSVNFDDNSIFIDFNCVAGGYQNTVLTMEWLTPSGQITDLSYGGVYFQVITYDSNSVTIDFSNANVFSTSNIPITLQTSSAPVPVPGAFWLMGSGLIGLVRLRKKFSC